MKNSAFYNSYQVLYAVFKNNAYSQIELNKNLESQEEGSDKPLITKIVYGVLENNIQLEYYLNKFYTKKPKLPTYIILKIGAYIHLYLNSIPSYALVNELVDLTKIVSKKEEAGFVNKVLKLILETPLQISQNKNSLEYLSIQYSYPIWLLKKLKEQYGMNVLNELLNAKQNAFKHIRINESKIKIEAFLSLLTEHKIEYEKSPLNNAVFVNYSKLLKVPALKNYYVVESLGSMLIVNSMQIKNGAQILDVCAAPGGKACYIAEQNKLGKVFAYDLYEHRVELIKKYASNMGLSNVITKQNDATILDKTQVNQFDYVLCDVPCSGIGVITKKPDILLFREEKSIQELSVLQQNILNVSSEYVKQGGVLLYSTCTLLKEENSRVIKAFLTTHTNFKLTHVHLPQINSVKENEMVTLLPNMENSEGYFIARLEKQ